MISRAVMAVMVVFMERVGSGRGELSVSSKNRPLARGKVENAGGGKAVDGALPAVSGRMEGAAPAMRRSSRRIGPAGLGWRFPGSWSANPRETAI